MLIANGADSDAAWVREHNAEVRRVLDGWRRDQPIRVPLLMYDTPYQHGIVPDVEPVDYRRYYGDPDEMIRVQLEAARLRRSLPIADSILGGEPEAWEVGVDFWPVPAPGWLGCELMIRRDTVIAHRPLGLDRDVADAMAMPDPARGNLLATIADFRERIAARCDAGLTYRGRPVRPVPGGVDHYGVLAMALDVRGMDFLVDMLEDRDWAKAFLLKMAEWCDALQRVWRDPGRRGYFNNTDHGIDLLSPEMYEEFIVPVIVEMNRRRGTGLPTGIHHCGRGTHLFPVIARCFPLERIDDLNYPAVDIARVRRDVGPEVWIKAEIDAGIVAAGPPERIRAAVAELLTPEVMGRGRFALTVGDLLPGTPLENRRVLYEAVREYGRYGPA